MYARAELTSTATARSPISPLASLVRTCLAGVVATTMVACPALDAPDAPGTDPPSGDDDGLGDTTWGVDPNLEIGGDDDDTTDLDLTEDDLAIEVASPQIDGLDSSSRLRVTWNELPTLPEILQLFAQDVAQDPPVEVGIEVGETEAVVGGLRSSTGYLAWLQACNGDTCVSSAPVPGTTAGEVWQMAGTGNQVIDAAPLVSDGNTKPYALRKGEGAADEGHVQLWYDPLPVTGKGVYLASQPAPPHRRSGDVDHLRPGGRIRTAPRGHSGR